MNFFKYVDIEFQKNTFAISGTQYNLKCAGYAQALQQVLGWARIYYRYTAIPRVLIGFLLVNLGLKKEPVSPLEEKIKPVAQAEQDVVKSYVGEKDADT